jgi:hypothetical protein
MVFDDVDDLLRCKVYYCDCYDYKIGGNYVTDISSNNPTFTFDNGLSRCGFQNLHIAERMSILDMPCDDTTSEYAEDDTLGTLVIKVSDILI